MMNNFSELSILDNLDKGSKNQPEQQLNVTNTCSVAP